MMKLVQQWRQEGLEVYFTVNTGQNIHLICEEKNKEKLIEKIKSLNFVNNYFINNPGSSPKITQEHLF